MVTHAYLYYMLMVFKASESLKDYYNACPVEMAESIENQLHDFYESFIPAEEAAKRLIEILQIS